MAQQDWLTSFDTYKAEFEWFIVKYFGRELWRQLIVARKEENIITMLAMMNEIWFELPDGIFNIYNSPKGWNSFLWLIEAEVIL